MLKDITGNKEVIVLEATQQYKQLTAYGLFKGTKLRVIRNDSWQGIVLVELAGKRIAIRREDAAWIKVQELN